MAEDDTEELTQLVARAKSAGSRSGSSGTCSPSDDAERAMAAAGMPMEENAGTKRLRKQEGRLKMEYRRAKAELLESRADAAAAAAGPAPATDPARARTATGPAGAVFIARPGFRTRSSIAASTEDLERGLQLLEEAVAAGSPRGSRDGDGSREASGRSASVPWRQPRAPTGPRVGAGV